ncbi:flagellar FlbD family protein [Pseudarthrobacter sp. NPDC092424]|uniref:flagellar FlbD family protein n=1 Tax=Pseudarthrobacter sp. NPDC092424 TaxID=3364415 RepID=UPI003805F235
MIVVTRLNGAQFAVNPDLIERMYASPDTTLVMVDGAKYIVTEPLDAVIDLIAGWRARVLAAARDLPVRAPEPGARPLSIVPPAPAAEQPPTH